MEEKSLSPLASFLREYVQKFINGDISGSKLCAAGRVKPGLFASIFGDFNEV